MTYDEAINTIAERYTQGDFPGWTMTDPDCAQMRRDLGNGAYEFVELFAYHDGTVALHHEEIDLDDYEWEDVLHYGSFYHENEEELLLQPREILSEYVFEQTCSMERYGFTPDMFDEYLKIVKEG